MDREAVRERIERAGAAVTDLEDFIRRRERDERALSTRDIDADLGKGEGILDRHRRIRESSEPPETELLTKTLARREAWRAGFTSAAYYLLSRSHLAEAFVTDDPRRSAELLARLFLGHGTHPVLASRFAQILSTPRYAQAPLPLTCLARLLEAAPERAYELAKAQLARPPVALDQAEDRFYLARALHRRRPDLPRDLAELDRSFDLGVDAGLLVVGPPSYERLEDDPRPALLEQINRRDAVAFLTGSDGVFRIRLTGGDLTDHEAARADRGTQFFVRSAGALRLDSGTERRSFPTPEGDFAVTVHWIDRSRADALPDYVLRFEPSPPRAEPPPRAELPTIPSL